MTSRMEAAQAVARASLDPHYREIVKSGSVVVPALPTDPIQYVLDRFAESSAGVGFAYVVEPSRHVLLDFGLHLSLPCAPATSEEPMPVHPSAEIGMLVLALSEGPLVIRVEPDITVTKRTDESVLA